MLQSGKPSISAIGRRSIGLEISHKSVLYRKIAVEGISSFVWMIDF
jgi:hypothetical protein